jgi:uncharacterized membrane protein
MCYLVDMSGIHESIKSVIEKVVAFTKNLVNTEGFQSKDKEADEPIVGSIIATLYTFLFGGMLIFLLIGYGAARLSFCYNQSIGTPIELTYVYAVLCFLFCYVYYPFYAIMLNPLCNKRVTNGSIRR